MAMAASRRGLFVISSVTSRVLEVFGQRSWRELGPRLHHSSSTWIEDLIKIRAGSSGWHQTGNPSPSLAPPGGCERWLKMCHATPFRTFSTSRFASSRSMRRIPRWFQQASKETAVEEERASHRERHEELNLLDNSQEVRSEGPMNDAASDPGLEGTFVIGSSRKRGAIDQRVPASLTLQRTADLPPHASDSFKDAETYMYMHQRLSAQDMVSSKRSNSFPDSKQVWREESEVHKSRFDNEMTEEFAPQTRRTDTFNGADTYPKPASQSKGSLKKTFSDIKHQQVWQKEVKGHKSRVNNPGWTHGEETTSEGSPGDEVQATDVETVSADLLEMDSREHPGVHKKSKAEGWRKHPNQENGKSFSFHKKAKEHLMTPPGHDLLYGISPCLLALHHARREVHQLYVTSAFQNSERSEVKEILALVEERGLRMWTTNRRVLDKFSEQRPHQGVCMETSRLYFSPVQEKEDKDVEEEGPVPASSVRLVLDQIKDPMNLGALLRSAYFLGIDKVIVSKKNCCSLTPVVSKASSGVMEIMPVYATAHIPSYLEVEKEKGWSIVGASVGSSSSPREVIPCHKYNQTAPILLVVGNEGFGLSSDISDQCSEFISIPAGRQLHAGIDSLNVSVATGILLHSLLGRK